MSEDHEPSHLAPIIIVLKQDAIPASEDAITALLEQLAEHGVTDSNTDRLALFGIVTGSAPADQLDPLCELDPVESVEPDETMEILENGENFSPGSEPSEGAS